eukprot:evm.model.scf_362EXC.2 EVM.evm.TU.scf_362EXC.2   scf_362EXC:26647-28833(-)
MFPSNPIVVVFSLVLYLFMATVSLTWFAYVYSGLYSLLLQARANDSLQPVHAVISVFLKLLDRIYGKKASYVPTPTHVILLVFFAGSVVLGALCPTGKDPSDAHCPKTVTVKAEG